jgi:hypothetical protein
MEVMDERTMWIAASVRLMKVGKTSVSPPAWSSALASHSERMVPTSWTKYSCHLRSGAGRPPALPSVSQTSIAYRSDVRVSVSWNLRK